MKKNIILFLLVMTMSACNFADKRISDLRTLTERVEKRGDKLTEKEWKEVYFKYANLEADFNDIQLTDEQADIVFNLKQRYARACMQSTPKKIDNIFENVISNDTLPKLKSNTDDSQIIVESDSSYLQ